MGQKTHRHVRQGYLALFCLFFAAGLACAHQPTPRETHHHKEHFPQGPLPEGVAPRLYDVTLTLDANSDTFVGKTSIAIELLEPHRQVFLHAEGLEFARAIAQSSEGRAHDVEISETPVKGLVRLTFSPPLPSGMATLNFRHRAHFSDQLDGLFVSERDSKRYIFSQMQFLAARKVFPCFDEPRFKAPLELSLIIPKGMRAIFNSSVLARQQTEGEQLIERVPEGFERLVFEPTPPLPTYLYALMVGPFDEQELVLPQSPERPYPIPLRGFAIANEGKKFTAALEHVAPLLLNLESFVNLPYVFRKLDMIAVPNFGMLGMENPGAIAFKDWLVLWDKERTSYEQRRNFEMVVAHELTHQWFGNFVTMAWWDDLWLNEAFATYSGLKAVGQVRPHMQMNAELWAGVNEAMHHDGLLSARRIRQPCLTRDDILGAADVITYQKGAGVLRMFENYLGEEAMQSGIQAYLRQFPFRSADAANFLATLSRSARRPELPEAINTFLQQPGVADVTVRWQCRSHTQASAIVTQNRWVPLGSSINTSSLWQIPVCLKVGTQRGTSETVCRLLKTGEMSFALPSCPTWLIPNAEGVGYYRWHVEPEQLASVTRALTEHHASAPEALAIVDGLWAAMEAGSLDAHDVLKNVVLALQTEHPRVGRRALYLLREAINHFVSPAELGAVLPRLVGHVAPERRRVADKIAKLETRMNQAARSHDLGDSAYDELGELRLWERDIIIFLAQLGGDEPLRQALVHDGVRRLEELLSVQNAQQTSVALAPLPKGAFEHDNNFASSAIALAGDAMGAPYVARIDAALGRVDASATERHILIAALAAMRAPPAAKAVRELLKGQKIEGSEALRLIEQQMTLPHLKDDAWAFVTDNFSAVTKGMSRRDTIKLVRLLGQLCQPGDSERVVATLSPLLKNIDGAKHALDEAREQSELCTTLNVEQGPAARRFFLGAGKLPHAAPAL